MRIGIAASAVFVAGVGLASPALAEAPSYVRTPPPQIQVASFSASSLEVIPLEVTSGGSHDPAGSHTGSHTALALTGGDLLSLGAFGVAVLGGGVAVRRLGRRRPRPIPA